MQSELEWSAQDTVSCRPLSPESAGTRMCRDSLSRLLSKSMGLLMLLPNSSPEKNSQQQGQAKHI